MWFLKFFFVLFITFYYSFQTLHKSRKNRVIRPYVLITQFGQLSTFFTPQQCLSILKQILDIIFCLKIFQNLFIRNRISFFLKKITTIVPNKMTKILNIPIVSRMSSHGWFKLRSKQCEMGSLSCKYLVLYFGRCFSFILFLKGNEWPQLQFEIEIVMITEERRLEWEVRVS